jgi:TIR domain
MRVFISWSGEPSRSVAGALRDWLPMVVQHVQPWMSEQDIQIGARWNDQLAVELERSDFGIICLTSSNQDSPWLIFEAGALAKHLKVARVVPLCIDLSPVAVEGPLSAFQGVSFSEDGMRRLVHDVSAVRRKPISKEQVDKLFDAMWPSLEMARRGKPSVVLPDSSTPDVLIPPLVPALKAVVAYKKRRDAAIRESRGEINPPGDGDH